MSRESRARNLVLLLVVVLAFYAVLIGVLGVSLLGDHRWLAKLLGLGVVLLPLVGVGIVAAELRFGRASERLAAVAGDAPEQFGGDDVGAVFERCRADVEAAPGEWRAWYWLAVAYRDGRDAARGRRAMRRAIALQGGSLHPPSE